MPEELFTSNQVLTLLTTQMHAFMRADEDKKHARDQETLRAYFSHRKTKAELDLHGFAGAEMWELLEGVNRAFNSCSMDSRALTECKRAAAIGRICDFLKT